MSTEAYRQGKQAYHDGCAFDMNRYMSRDPESMQWINGYVDAQIVENIKRERETDPASCEATQGMGGKNYAVSNM